VRTRRTHACSTRHGRDCLRPPRRKASHCARAMRGWARGSCKRGVMHTPNNTNACAAPCAACALGWAGSFARSNARSRHLRPRLSEILSRAKRLHSQQRDTQYKLYSWHAPEVECIAKGKARKPYEFGVKVGLAITAKEGFVVGDAMHAVLCGAGHNLCLLLGRLRAFLRWLYALIISGLPFSTALLAAT
jgi:hypothetical protein